MAELIVTRVNGGRKQRLYIKQFSDATLKPVSDLKNTIAIISDITINKVCMSDDITENPENGDIIILCQDGDTFNFSSNTVNINLSIIKIQQYNGTEWNNVEAYLYNGDEWVKVSSSTIWLYNRGTRETEITGGWGTAKGTDGRIAWNSGYLRIYYVDEDSTDESAVYTKNAIDLAGFSKLVLKCTIPARESSSDDPGKYRIVAGFSTTLYTGYSDTSAINACVAYVSVAQTFSSEKTFELDVSRLDGSYYLQLAHHGCDWRIYEIYLT